MSIIFTKFAVFLLCVVGNLCDSVPAQEEEPNCCSRFGCEYKILQRLSELETLISQQKKIIEALQASQVPRHEVAFSAYLTHDVTGFGNYLAITFDHVITNIGGAYNGKSGIFACYQPGVYVFYWVITNKDRTWMDSELVVNGIEQCQAFSDSGNHDDYAVASNVVVVDLKKGDQVWIRSGTWHNAQFGGERRSSFSGWLLYSH